MKAVARFVSEPIEGYFIIDSFQMPRHSGNYVSFTILHWKYHSMLFFLGLKFWLGGC